MLRRGFTLLEVLVTLVILMFGLLGIAGLMAKGQRASYEAFQRQQALALASDMIERIRGNQVQATAYIDGAPITSPRGIGNLYSDLVTGALTPNCGVSSCTPDQLVNYDLALWDGLLFGYTESNRASGALVGGIMNARGCIEELANTQACPGLPFTRTVRVSVAWQGNEDTAAPTTSNCGTGVYGFETRRRVVSIDLMALQSCP